MEKINPKECIRFGWETFKKRPWLIIGAFVVTGGLSAAFQYSPEGDAAPEFSLLILAVILVGIVIGTLAEIGMTTFMLKAHDSVSTVKFMDIWNPKPFWQYLFGKILVTLAVLLGFVLLIIPGLILCYGLMLAPYLIVDKGRGPVEAMKESWKLTKGHKWQLVSLSLLILGINILGLLALVFGLLVSIPVSMLAVVHVYRKLSAAA